MNFEELLKYCTELNESKNEKCLVCHIPIDSDEKYIKLECSHIFHSDCVKYKSGILKCLYCEKSSTPSLLNYSNTNLLPLLPNIIYCKMILKTGPNKGKFCNRPDCKYHKIDTKPLQVIDVVTNKPIKIIKPKSKPKPKNFGCQILIKTGPKTGQPCGRLECKYHNEQQKSDKKNKNTTNINNKIINWVEPITKAITQPTFNEILQMTISNFVDGKELEEDLFEV